MSTNKLFLKQILTIAICTFFFSCTSASQNQLPNPEIKSGIAKVVGKVVNPPSELSSLTLWFRDPVTTNINKFETHLNKDGSFYFEVPTQCTPTLGYISSDVYRGSVALASDKETKLEIIYDKAGNKTASMVSSIDLTSNDILNLSEVMDKMMEHRSPDSERHYTTDPTEFTQNAMKSLDRKLEIAANDTTLSNNGKKYVSNEFKLVMLDFRLLDYNRMVEIDYLNTIPEERPDTFIPPQKPDRSYYVFLKYFNLNDPQYLYNGTYPQVLQTILSNETLNIPAINDTPINEWMKGVKTIMADLVGFDDGLFYEMLAANAYARQFNNEVKSLSDKQKENIQNYFKNKEITKILLARDEVIRKLSKENL